MFVEANQIIENTPNKIISDIKVKPLHCQTICKELTPNQRYTYEEVVYAARQLCMSDYVISNMAPKMAWHQIKIEDLTWEGHSFINAVRGENMWGLTKRAGKKIGNLSIKDLSFISQALLQKGLDNPTKLQEFADTIHKLF